MCRPLWILFILTLATINGYSQVDTITLSGNVQRFDAVLIIDSFNSERDREWIPIYGTISFGADSIFIRYKKRERSKKEKTLSRLIMKFEILENSDVLRIRYNFDEIKDPWVSSFGVVEYKRSEGTYTYEVWGDGMLFVFEGEMGKIYETRQILPNL